MAAVSLLEEPQFFSLRGAQQVSESNGEVHEFYGPEAQADYFQWLLNNPYGFVLNLKQEKEAVLHKSLCFHIGVYHYLRMTQKPKFCASSRALLQALAQDRGVDLDYCQTCCQDCQ